MWCWGGLLPRLALRRAHAQAFPHVQVSKKDEAQVLYDKQDVLDSLERIEVVNFEQRVTVNNISFVAYNAGHVLGAAMFLIEIAGVKILYTGDYSREEDRHLAPATIPSVRPDILITVRLLHFARPL